MSVILLIYVEQNGLWQLAFGTITRGLICTDFDELKTDLDGRERAVVGWVICNRNSKHFAATSEMWQLWYIIG